MVVKRNKLGNIRTAQQSWRVWSILFNFLKKPKNYGKHTLDLRGAFHCSTRCSSEIFFRSDKYLASLPGVVLETRVETRLYIRNPLFMPNLKRNKTLEKVLSIIFNKYPLNSSHIITWE